MLVVGTGIGAGIVVDGEVLNGATGLAGEIGHTSLNVLGETYFFMRKCGLFERKSTVALVNRVKSDETLVKLFANTDEINGKTIFDLYEQKNEQIKPVVDEWSKYIAVGVANVVNIFNPEIVSGGAISQREIFMEFIKTGCKKICTQKIR